MSLSELSIFSRIEKQRDCDQAEPGVHDTPVVAIFFSLAKNKTGALRMMAKQPEVDENTACEMKNYQKEV